MQLSIVMIVKNESKHLDNCLKSLAPIRKELDSELIIVDTGSTDNTVEIAKNFTNNVYIKKWNDNFGEMRNEALSYAIGEWLFIIDGDEVIENTSEIVEFFKDKKYKSFNSATIKIKNYVGDRINSILSQARLFKNTEDFKYTGAIHEQPRIKEPTAHLSTYLLHYGYDWTDMELRQKKFQRNVEIILREIHKEPKNIYHWFQLVQTYCFNEEYEKGLEAILKAQEIARELKIKDKDVIYIPIYLLRIYYWLERYDKAENTGKRIVNISGEYLDVFYILGNTQRNLCKYDEAIESFNRYLDMVFNYKKYKGYNDLSVETISADMQENVYANMCLLYYKKAEYKKSIDYVLKINSSINIHGTLIYAVDNFIKLKDFHGLKEFYKTKILDKEKELVEEFNLNLEKSISKLSKSDRRRILQDYSRGDDEYSVLNKIRLEDLNNNDKLEKSYLDLVEGLDFNNLPEIYGDIIYYLLKRKYPIGPLLKNTNLSRMEGYFNYLIKQYQEEYSKIAIKLIDKVKKQTLEFSDLRVYKVFTKTLITSDILTGDDFEKAVDVYIKAGIEYTQRTINNTIIENEMIFDVREETGFIILMIKAENYKKENKRMYNNYLLKALKLYPEMKQVIQLFSNQVKQSEATHHQLDNARGLLKEQIKNLIEQGNIEEAYKIIEEYEKLIEDDFEINSYKLIIAIMINDIELAEFFLVKGLAMDSNNADLLYNAGYIYGTKGDFEKSIHYYSMALDKTNNEELKNEITEALDEMKTKEANLSYEDKAFEKYRLRIREGINKLNSMKVH